MLRIKQTDFKRFGTIIVLGLMVAAQMTMHAQAALPAGQQRVFDDGIGYFNIEPDVIAGCSGGGATGNGAALVGSDNAKKAFNYFIQTRGLTPAQSAGIVGNLLGESGGLLIPDIVQGGGRSETPVAGKGYGIGQWTDAPRQAGLVKLAQQEGKPASDFGVQLDYIWLELNTTEKRALDDLKADNIYVPGKSTAYNAAVSFLINFERAKDHAANGPNAIKRGGYADQLVGGPVVPTTGGSNTNSLPTTTGTGVSGCAASSVVCNTSATTPTVAQLSPVRTQAVCLAQQELAVWQAPGVQPAQLCSKYGAGKPCLEWCAFFVSWIFDQAKYPLKPDPNWQVGPVQGIWDIGKLNQNFHFHPAAGYTPKPGDIVIYKEGMSHTNIVVDISNGMMITIGGDQGPGPYGGPNSRSIVSEGSKRSFTGDSVTGFVSPD